MDGTLRPAAFFDLDKTIIAKSSALAFSRPLYRGGLIRRSDVLRSAYAQSVYLLGGADHDQMERMREYLSALASGWKVSQVKSIVAEALQDVVEPIIYEEAALLIDEHHAAGRDVVIVSSSGSELVEQIGAMLGADHSIGTELIIDGDEYTGEIKFYAYGDNKAVAMRDLAEREGYDLSESFAYSDSMTDLPMLETVGHPFAVNPDRALRREALARGWPTLEFTRPVSLRTRVQAIPPQHKITTAVTAAAVTGVVVWLIARRKSRRRGSD